ncbi:MAG: hypothetical protein A2745_03680 [Candidatus Harrisonbacteria bacterium RIFCSPHIGHO2_01_FULL_44_13]|nr:MAG: hypothetical protein A2745_03680 [Candidatus Harrisonbacteria bacterium RIFCSPHIGHO2_01_FULL_44_13]
MKVEKNRESYIIKFSIAEKLIFPGSSAVERRPVNAVDPESSRRITLGSFLKKFRLKLFGITVKPLRGNTVGTPA